ncbi:MAG: hypothetical protein ACRC1Y_04955 [Paraclostridium sp.]
MNKDNMELLNEIEISSKSIEQRIIELKTIINMKICYRDQIKLIERLTLV